VLRQRGSHLADCVGREVRPQATRTRAAASCGHAMANVTIVKSSSVALASTRRGWRQARSGSGNVLTRASSAKPLRCADLHGALAGEGVRDTTGLEDSYIQWVAR
jgi:hypothetical protein